MQTASRFCYLVSRSQITGVCIKWSNASKSGPKFQCQNIYFSCLSLRSNPQNLLTCKFCTDSKNLNNPDDSQNSGDEHEAYFDERIPGTAKNTPVKGLSLKDPVKGDLVYYGEESRLVKSLKIFSFGTSVILGAMLPFIGYQQLSALAKISLGGVFGCFFLCTPLLIHVITRKYVTDLYYNSETEVFTARTISFFCTYKTHIFKPEDVTIPEFPTMFTFMKVNERPFFIDERDLRSIESFKKLMGYDKPLELLYQDEIEKLKKRKEEMKKYADDDDGFM